MAFKCRYGCSDCCGLVPIPKDVFEANKSKVQVKVKELLEVDDEVYPMHEGMKCVFLDRGTDNCLIYSQRPQVCRDYGTVEAMPCPYIKPNGRPRNPAQARHWQRKISHDIDENMRKLRKRLER